MLRGALALLLLAACERQPPSGVHATREQCEQIVALEMAHAAALNAAEAAMEHLTMPPRNGVHAFGFRRWNVFFPDDHLERCQERTTRTQADCEIARARDGQIDMSPCKPEVDLRPPDARRTPDECARYVEKVRALAAAAPPDPRMPRPVSANVVSQGAAHECADWLSRARFNCTLAAQTDADRMRCPR